MSKKHKYNVGDELWVAPYFGTGQSAFKATVNKCSKKCVCHDAKTGLPIINNIYTVSASGYSVYGAFSDKSEEIVTLEIDEFSVLANYNDENEMKKFM